MQVDFETTITRRDGFSEVVARNVHHDIVAVISHQSGGKWCVYFAHAFHKPVLRLRTQRQAREAITAAF